MIFHAVHHSSALVGLIDRDGLIGNQLSHKSIYFSSQNVNGTWKSSLEEG